MNNQYKQSLKYYKEGIEGLYNIKCNRIIGSSTPPFHAVLHEVLFNNATDKISIYYSNLDSRVFDSFRVIEAFKNAINRGVHADILITATLNMAINFEKVANSLGIKIYTDAPVATIKDNKSFGMCIIDNNAYNYIEYPSICEDMMNCCFYDKGMVRSFEKTFDRIKIKYSEHIIKEGASCA